MFDQGDSKVAVALMVIGLILFIFYVGHWNYRRKIPTYRALIDADVRKRIYADGREYFYYAKLPVPFNEYPFFLSDVKKLWEEEKKNIDSEISFFLDRGQLLSNSPNLQERLRVYNRQCERFWTINPLMELPLEITSRAPCAYHEERFFLKPVRASRNRSSLEPSY